MKQRHQVLVGGGGALQLGERRLDGGRVAARLGRLEAADLLALQRRVDLQGRDLLVADSTGSR